jgi:hypothetical protein
MLRRRGGCTSKTTLSVWSMPRREAMVGECGHRLQVLPEAEGHRNLVLRWRSGEAGGKSDLAPGMKSCSHIPYGEHVKSIAGVGRSVHVRYAVHEPLNLRVTTDSRSITSMKASFGDMARNVTRCHPTLLRNFERARARF